MGIPILTSSGFVGQRWIIDDYFQAGETLRAGDVAGIKQGPASQSNLPRVFKIDGNVDARRVIGIVHTPTGMDVGDQVATSGDYVQIVLSGVAKALSAGAIGVGDPVVPSESTGRAPGGNWVSMVAQSTSHYHSSGTQGETGVGDSHIHNSGPVGVGGNHNHLGTETTGNESAHIHSGGGGGNHDHEIGYFDASVQYAEPTHLRTARVRKADGTYGYAYVGGIFGNEDREDLRTGPAAASSSGGGSGAAHNHSSGAVSYSGIHTHVGTGTTGDEASHKHGIDSEDGPPSWASA